MDLISKFADSSCCCQPRAGFPERSLTCLMTHASGRDASAPGNTYLFMLVESAETSMSFH